MPFANPFKLKAAATTGEEDIFCGPPGLVPRKTSISIRSEQPSVTRIADYDTYTSPMDRPMEPPPAQTSWGSLHPSIPKKVSLTRRTLSSKARNGAADDHYMSILRDTTATPFEARPTPAQTRKQLLSSEQDVSLLPKRMVNLKRHSYSSSRRSSIAPPGDTGLHGWTEQRSSKHYSAPVSKFSSSSGALARAADKTAHLTALDAERRALRQAKPSKQSLQSQARSSPRRSEEKAADEIMHVALDQRSLSHEGPHEVVDSSSRSARHAANKRLYHKMKAENHNLWVLLDASNRRADLMMQTLRDEEERCQTLEQRAKALQSTLDTLNQRRLMLRDSTNAASVYTQNSSEDAAVATNAADVEQATAELEHIRMNLARSRNSVRHLQRIADEAPPVPAMPSAYADLQTPKALDALEQSIRSEMQPAVPQSARPMSACSIETTFTQVDNMESRLRHLIKPKAVRPAVCSTEQTLLDHIDSIMEEPPEYAADELGAFTEFSTVPSAPPTPPKDCATPVPSSQPMARQGSGSTSHSASSSYSHITATGQSSVRTGTPELSSGSDSGRSRSGSEASVVSRWPSPPPKSARRLVGKASVGQMSTSEAHIHPALRTSTQASLTLMQKPLREMSRTPMIEGLDLAV